MNIKTKRSLLVISSCSLALALGVVWYINSGKTPAFDTDTVSYSSSLQTETSAQEPAITKADITAPEPTFKRLSESKKNTPSTEQAIAIEDNKQTTNEVSIAETDTLSEEKITYNSETEEMTISDSETGEIILQIKVPQELASLNFDAQYNAQAQIVNNLEWADENIQAKEAWDNAPEANIISDTPGLITESASNEEFIIIDQIPDAKTQ